jgi:hypothetical protein
MMNTSRIDVLAMAAEEARINMNNQVQEGTKKVSTIELSFEQ